tara:strand:+ start:219 stop:458 length:240 start_codon:yes stop_codon:yes gene_type:complete
MLSVFPSEGTTNEQNHIAPDIDHSSVSQQNLYTVASPENNPSDQIYVVLSQIHSSDTPIKKGGSKPPPPFIIDMDSRID